MTQPYRLREGGHIDRARALGFSYDGTPYVGYAGDTLASALIANGVHLVGRSFKYHRPRGIFTAGGEEPNAIVQLARGARTEPNVHATTQELYDGLVAASQNCWPSVRFDVGALADAASGMIPAGFYYKTFMWPASPRAWLRYERAIRRAAGMGRRRERARSRSLRAPVCALRRSRDRRRRYRALRSTRGGRDGRARHSL